MTHRTGRNDPNDANNELDHFVQLARRGNFGGASGGALRCHLLAEAVIKHAPGVDSSAIAGFLTFVLIAHEKPGEAADLYRTGGGAT